MEYMKWLKEVNMKVFGKMVSRKDLGFIITDMVLRCTKEYGKLEILMDKENHTIKKEN